MSHPLEILLMTVQAAVETPDNRRTGCLLGLGVIAAAGLVVFFGWVS